MLVISLNINDFGSVNEHLACYKKTNYYGKEVFDWASWRKIDKTYVIDKLKSFIIKEKPTILILQEFELNNSDGPMSFLSWMKDNGYQITGVMPTYKLSMTIFFVKSDSFVKIDINHSKTGIYARDYAIKIGEYIIYGTHVPLNSKSRPTVREDYWSEIIEFYEDHKTEKVILIGDFNTYGESTEAHKRYQELLKKGAYDLWLKLGNSNDTPTELEYRNRLDYAFISPCVEKHVKLMEINTDIMYKDKISDHAAIILRLE